MRARMYNFSFFGQDIWRVTPRLTLTYGVRWEINTPFGSITPGSPLYAVNGVFNSKPFGFEPVSALWRTHFGNFGPRIGAAYQITPRTILRGGFGLFYDIGFGGGIGQMLENYPYAVFGVGKGPVPFDLSNPAFLPPPVTFNPNTAVYLYSADPNLNLPRVLEWNLAVEQALGKSQSVSVTYVGAHGTGLLREDAYQNNPTGPPVVFATHNADWSNFNSLQVQFKRRLSAGLQVLASYALTNSKDTNSTDVCGCTYTNDIHSVNPALDYGPSTFDIRNSFSAAVSYQIPWNRPDKISAALLKNWSLYGVWHASSSPPFSVYAVPVSPIFGPYYTRADIVPGQPLYLPDPSQPGGRILNSAAFVTPQPGEYGNEPRNSLRAFPTDQLDLAVSRRFRLTDRLSLDFRVEYFNALNHPMFAGPWANYGTTVGSYAKFGLVATTLNDAYSGAGGLSSLYQIGGPRSGQLTLKLQF
jgi:hypothetical protein